MEFYFIWIGKKLNEYNFDNFITGLFLIPQWATYAVSCMCMYVCIFLVAESESGVRILRLGLFLNSKNNGKTLDIPQKVYNTDASLQ